MSIGDAQYVRAWHERTSRRAQVDLRRVDFLAGRHERDAALAQRYREHLARLFNGPEWGVAWRAENIAAWLLASTRGKR